MTVAAAQDGGRPTLLVLGRVVSGYTWALLDQVRRRGVEVRVIFREAAPSLAAQLGHDELTPGAGWAVNADRRAFLATMRFLAPRQASAILQIGASNLLQLMLCLVLKRRSTPVYFFSDGNPDTVRRWSPRDLIRRALYTSMRPAFTEAWALGSCNEEALRILGFRRQQRLPLYAVDFGALGRARAGETGAAPGRIRLLCIARLAPEKNLLALVEALAEEHLAARVQLTIAGEGPERARLEDLLRRRSLEVRLLGAVPRREMPQVLGEADALILPSTYEPWGIAVVEALGLGLPVVATPCVASAVSLAPTNHGVLLASGTGVAALRDAVERLLVEFDDRRAAAAAGAPAVREAYDVERVAGLVGEAVLRLGAARGRGSAA